MKGSDWELIVANYNYVPTLAPNAVGLAFACFFLIFHTIFGVWYRQWWFFVCWFIGLVFDIVGYSFRVAASQGHYNDNGFKIQYAFFILCPAFLMGGIYYQMSKLLTIYGQHFAPFKPMFYSGAFIGCDLVSIIIQGVGGGLAVDDDPSTSDKGRWIILAGIIFQAASMAWFFLEFSRLVWKISRSHESDFDPRYEAVRRRRLFPLLVPAVYVAWCFIYARNIYRLVELAEGWVGFLAVHEVYFLVLECLMVTLAAATLTIVYPAFCYGKDSIAIEGLHYKYGKRGDEAGGKVAADEEEGPEGDFKDEYYDAREY